jgi:excisionase family DNA binding protein
MWTIENIERHLALLERIAERADELANELQALRAALASGGTGEGRVALPVADAARLLGCSSRQVYKLLAERKLRPGAKVGRSKTVTRASLDALAVGEAERAARKTAPKPARAPGRPRRVPSEVPVMVDAADLERRIKALPL